MQCECIEKYIFSGISDYVKTFSHRRSHTPVLEREGGAGGAVFQVIKCESYTLNMTLRGLSYWSRGGDMGLEEELLNVLSPLCTFQYLGETFTLEDHKSKYTYSPLSWGVEESGLIALNPLYFLTSPLNITLI